MALHNLTGFEKFCGGRFWDTQLTWNTTRPRFSDCFENSVLVWAPCALLWLALPFYAPQLRRNHTTSATPVTRLFTAKIVLNILLILVSLLNVIKTAVEMGKGDDPYLILLVSPAVLSVTLLLSTILMNLERKRGFYTSGIQFIFWLLLFVAGIVPFYTKILGATTDDHVDRAFRFTTFYVYYAGVILQLLLTFFADLPPGLSQRSGIRPCPEITASFPSRLVYWWINGLVLTGYKKGLEEKDVFQLHPRDITDNNAPHFMKAWQDELDRSHWVDGKDRGASYSERSHLTSRRPAGYGSSERTPLLSGDMESNGHVIIRSPSVDGRKRKNPSLFRALRRTYGSTMLVAWSCKLVCDILTFVGPMLQSRLIEFTEDKQQQLWKGYLYAALFFVNGTVSSVFFHQLFHIGMTLGMRIKSAIIAAVYQKALTMSNEARKDTTVGEIVNLMSVDAQRLQDVSGYLWMMWSAPLQIVIAVYMLWGIVGPSVMAGLAVMVLLIPVNGVLANFQRKLQIAQMTQKDQRIKLMNEVLNGMKVLKLYAWELSFQEKITAIRNLELATLKRYAYLSAVGTFTWTCAPFMVTLITYLTWVLSGHTLDAQTAFVSLSLFNILRFPINLLPMMISYIVTASVSLKRISKYLKQGDIDDDCVSHQPVPNSVISIANGTFAWGTGDEDLTVLRSIDLDVQKGELLAVVGTVGSGKSSLISAMLGEMEKLDGHVNVHGKIAYVAQQAWIQNATLKDNILFWKPFDQRAYDRAIDACALRPDLDILPGGDLVEIGEKGINLSGGQKQRVSLSRAVYNDADVYLLDDPLSAVDSHVGKHIFNEVIGPNGMLKHKTRILVTHGVQWLPKVDRIAVITDGRISEIGSYTELLDRNGAFAQFLKTYLDQSDDEEEEQDPEVVELKMQILQRVDSLAADTTTDGTTDGTASGPSLVRRQSSTGKPKLGRHPSRKSPSHQNSVIEKEAKKPAEPVTGQKLIEEEASAKGNIKWGVFFGYCSALGGLNVILITICFLLYQVASVYSSIWLSEWTQDPVLTNTSYPPTSPVFEHKQTVYLSVYGSMGVAQALFVLAYAIITAYSMVLASGKLHLAMLDNILRSPMSFFDTTPIGRILNRFSRDIETIDNILPNLLRSWINNFFLVLSTIVVISYSTPIFLSVVVPLGILYYFIQRFYVPTSRQLKRIESTTRSPIYTNFSETITGASTIRAYGEQRRFIEHNNYLVDHNLVFYFSSIASNRWLGFRLEFVGSAVVLAAAMFAVIGRNTLNGGLVGLSISYALQVTQSLNWMVRMTSDLESNIVSVERVKEYSDTPQEAEWYVRDTKPPSDWPREGRVAFDNYSTRYRQGLDLVISDITASVSGGQKIGIVGRTGAGKSSLTVALFRIIEAAGGSIHIDDIHIANLGLHELRSKITILPQDPVIFSGTLRMNLDPFDKYSDEQLWQALQLSHLHQFVSTLPAGLMYECGEGGQNLSVGQRQLVCLARTLLRKTKILILDEATAAVDLETDELIQNTIRKEFAECTILTIAHRLNTIMDSDRILVLDKGKIAEFETPAKLLKNKSSIFYGMAKDANIVS